MVVNTRAQKIRIPAGILRRALLKIANHFLLGKRSWQVQRFFQPVFFGNGRKQLFNVLHPDGRQHLLALRRALRQVAHQADASFFFSAMYASYAGASISVPSSAAVARLILISHPAPWGSVLMASGLSFSAPFDSATSPLAGA